MAAYWRLDVNERLLIINNLSPDNLSLEITLPELGHKTMVFQDLLAGNDPQIVQDDILRLAIEPYEYRWLSVKTHG